MREPDPLPRDLPPRTPITAPQGRGQALSNVQGRKGEFYDWIVDSEVGIDLNGEHSLLYRSLAGEPIEGKISHSALDEVVGEGSNTD